MNSVVGVTLIHRLASVYQNNKALSLELLGCNLPKTLMARTPEERLDIAANENLNALGYFGGMAALSGLLNNVLPKVRTVFESNPKILGLAKTALMVPLFAGGLMAVPFYRNAITAALTQTSDFKSLLQGVHSIDTDWREKVAHHKQKAKQFLMAGALVGVIAFAAVLRLSVKDLHRLAQQFDKGIMSANPLQAFKNDAQALAYWAAPVYAGSFLATRDRIEQQEQLLKFVNFATLYAVPGMVIKHLFQPKLLTLTRLPQTKEVLLKITNINALKEASSLLLSTFLMAVSPQWMNIILTKKRLQQPSQVNSMVVL